MASSPAGLGYPGSQNLVRMPDGIHLTSFLDSRFRPLGNYPALVKITRTAIEKMDRDFRNFETPSINIYAISNNGISSLMFGINSLFFSRVHEKLESDEPELTFEVGSFVFDPIQNSLSSYGGKTERSFHGSVETNPYLRNVKEFRAKLLSTVEYSPIFNTIRSTHHFASEYFENFPELLVLSMDVAKDGQWKLELQQKIGRPLSNEKREQLFDEKIKTVSRATLSNKILCPITRKVLEDPILLSSTWQSYERKALNHWAILKIGEPVPVYKNPYDRIFEKAYELSIKLENLEWTPDLQREVDHLEYLSERANLVYSGIIPKEFCEQWRAIWIIEYLLNERSELFEHLTPPVFIQKNDLARANQHPMPQVQAVADVFRLTHTIY